MEENEYKKLLSKMCNLCARGEKCEFDIRKKLNKIEIEETDLDSIIKYLNENNYINEERYALAFANDKFKFNKWGKRKISLSLKLKYINEKNIQKALTSLNTSDYKAVLLEILIKKRKQITEKNEFKLKQKLLNHAVSKGFEPDIIFEVISEYKLSQL